MLEESPSIARAAELSAPAVSSLSTLTMFQPIGIRPAKILEAAIPIWRLGSKLAARTVTLRSAGREIGEVYMAELVAGVLPSIV